MQRGGGGLSGRDGAPQWARIFGGAGDDIGRDVSVSPSGTVLLTGHFSSGVEPSVGAADFGPSRLLSAGDSNAFLAAFSGDGRCLWARSISGPNFDVAAPLSDAHLALTPAGDLAMVGHFTSTLELETGSSLQSEGRNDVALVPYSARREASAMPGAWEVPGRTTATP